MHTFCLWVKSWGQGSNVPATESKNQVHDYLRKMNIPNGLWVPIRCILESWGNWLMQVIKPQWYLKSHGSRVKFLLTGKKKKEKEIKHPFLRKIERTPKGTTDLWATWSSNKCSCSFPGSWTRGSFKSHFQLKRFYNSVIPWWFFFCETVKDV